MDSDIQYDYSGALLDDFGLDSADLDERRLGDAREKALADERIYRTDAAAARTLDPEFIHLPDRLLAEFRRDGEKSELASIISAADRLADRVDRFVVVGIGGSYMGPRALFEALCRPYFNECDRAARANRPRIYFQGNHVDTDSLVSLLELLNSDDTPWGVVAISKSGGTLEPALALRAMLQNLEKSCGGQALPLKSVFIPITGQSGGLRKLATDIGCEAVFPVPDGVGGRFSVFSAVGLLPAAILGLDVVRLLEGAAHMTRRFVEEPPLSNPVLTFAGVCHAMEMKRNATCRVLSVWSSQLESFGFWYDQLLSESLGKQGRGATPFTAVNPRDLHSRGQQHQDGRRDKLITNVVVEEPRQPSPTIGQRPHDYDHLNKFSSKSWRDVLAAVCEGTNHAYRQDGRPTASLILPRLDEFSLGQLMQLMMLATVVEGKLIDVNPYGQPAVEAYKRETQAALAK